MNPRTTHSRPPQACSKVGEVMPRVYRASTICAVLCLQATLGAAQVSVLTHHNDNGRTGQNLAETTLNTSTVNVSNFGKLFTRTVDGQIYAQPLYVPALNIAGTTRNVIYVATENNSVYAFDADDSSQSSPLWTVNLGTSVPSPDICNNPAPDCYNDLMPEIGITSTPVIDSSSGTIYVVAKTKNTSNTTYHFNLHALDLLTGGEKFGGPVEISASEFVPLNENNRPGLLLVNGTIYIGFGSVGDFKTWHGFVFAYNETTLMQTAVYNDTAGSGANGGGIWGGQQGLVADANNPVNVYVATSNGTFDVNTGGSDYASSILKLSTSNGLKVADYFAPDDQSFLNGSNADLGAGGPVLLPGTTLLVAGGKDGILRVVDTTNMGKFNPTFNGNLQDFQATNVYPNGMIMGSPIYWNSPNFGPVIYLWGPSDVIKAWQLSGETFLTTPVSQGQITSPAGISNEAAMSLSADASGTGTGIVWAARPYSGDANAQAQPGILHAFDATNLTHELWDSNQNPARDNLGDYAKFSPPTIANGKVYLATFSNQLVVYGLNPPPATAISFIQVAAATPQSTTSTVSVPYAGPQIAGDLNIVVVGWNDTTATVQSVKDSLGNTYALAAGPTKGTGITQSIYYAKNIVPGTNTVTVTFSQAASFPDVRVLEYAGADTTSPLDVTASASGSGTAPNSGSATTTVANELIFAANTVFTANSAPGATFTQRIITSPDGDLAEDKTVSSTGSYNASASLGSSGPWVMQMATFKMAAGTGGSPPTVTSVSPNSGSVNGGTAVIITGTNFAAGATVTFGGTSATNVSVVSTTSITATTPAHAAAAVNVVVTNSNGQSGTLTNGYTYTSTVSTIKFIQVAAATPQSPSSTVSVSYATSQIAGDMNIVVVGWNDSTSVVQSVKDSLGNSYSLAIGPTTGTALRQSIYYAKNIVSGSNKVTVTFNQAATFPDIRILEYSGLDTTSPLDQTAGASGKSATPSSGSATTKFATELIFGANTVFTGNKAAGTGFVVRIITSPDADLAEDEMVTAKASYSATATLGASGAWVMQMATFKALGQ